MTETLLPLTSSPKPWALRASVSESWNPEAPEQHRAAQPVIQLRRSTLQYTNQGQKGLDLPLDVMIAERKVR